MSTRAEREAQARKLRDEGLLLREIAAEMGVAFGTVSDYLNDPGGGRLRARKDSYRGECDTCGCPTDGSNGREKASTRCQRCRNWTPEAIIEAFHGWADEHGGIPPREIDTTTSGEGHGQLPTSNTVKRHFGSWNAGLLAAGYALHMDKRPETTAAMAEMIRNGMSVEDVGAHFGVGKAAVYVRLKYHGMLVSELRKAA